MGGGGQVFHFPVKPKLPMTKIDLFYSFRQEVKLSDTIIVAKLCFWVGGGGTNYRWVRDKVWYKKRMSIRLWVS